MQPFGRVEASKWEIFSAMTTLSATTRLRSFDLPHKGLRNLLAQLNQLAGNIDFSDHEQVDRLERTGKHLFQLLTEHAHIEDEYVLKDLEQRCPGASLQNAHEHEIITEQQAGLEALLEELIRCARLGEEVGQLAEQFYLSVNHFHSAYLQHMLEEEEVTQKQIWKYFSEAELMDMHGQIARKMAPESTLLWFRYSAPAMKPQGRLQWLLGVKAAAPAPFFEQVLAVLEDVLPEKAYQQLTAGLI